MEQVIIFGRFPSPVDGQSLLTERFAKMINANYEIEMINSSVRSDAGWFQKISSYVRSGRELQNFLKSNERACLVWQSISPQPSGHFRDFLTIYPYLRHHPVIAVVHWGDFDRLFRSPATSVSAKWLTRRISKLVFNTDNLSSACSAWLSSDRRAVIPNTVDAETHCSDEEVTSKRDRARDDVFRVLYLSNMIESKGYLDVLQSAILLNDHKPKIEFDFIGNWYSDNDRKEFERLLEEGNLKDMVRHHGPVRERVLIKDFHLRADAFVLPSYYPTEAQPVSIIEALSAGTPIITTDHGGIREMVTDGEEALKVPAKSPSAIADAIRRLTIPTTWLELSLRARRHFLEKYHPDVIRKQWIDLIDTVVIETESLQ